MRELPTIGSSAYSASTFDMPRGFKDREAVGAAIGVVMPRRHQVLQASGGDFFIDAVRENVLNKQEKPKMRQRRLVQVVIADPDPKIPTTDALIYEGKSFFTDLDNTDLFYEVDIKPLLAAHNEKRLKTVDKTVKDRTEFLEPVRVSDLKMVVVEIAKF